MKGRGPGTGYTRAAFGPPWRDVDRNGCDTRNDVLQRASWLPPNKEYRCDFVWRQETVKKRYSLSVTRSERDAMQRVLSSC